MIIETLFGEQADILRTHQFRLLLLANTNAALGTVLVSPLLESLTGPFAVSDVRIGLLMTALTAPSVVGIPVIGMLSDRFGRKPILVTGLLLFGLAGTGIAFTTDFEVALALRGLQGIGYSGITPVIITAIGDLYAESKEATAQGLRFTSSGAAQATFPLIAGVLVGVAWQFPFFIYFIAVPIAVMVALWFEEPGGPSAADSRGAPATDGAPRPRRSTYMVALGGLSIQPKIAAVLIAFTVPSFLYLAFLTYNSFLVVTALGGSPGVAGLLTTVISVIYAIAASQAGRITDYFGSRVVPLVFSNVCMGLGISLTAFAPTIPVAIVGTAVMGLGVGLAFSLLRSVLTGLAPETYRGGLVGVGESTIRLSMSVAPIVLGGLVAVFAPAMGSNGAIRYSLLTAGVVGAIVGSVAILLARIAPAVEVG